VVARRARAAEGVIVLDLRDPSGARLPSWSPGAHIDLILRPGLVRQFSLCGDPADHATWRIAVLREPAGRGGSQHVHDQITVGAAVQVRGPRNNFRLADAGRYLFIAGGIGITPIRPMVAAADGAGRPWTLTYGGRTRASMAFRGELCARYTDRVRIRPQDETGLLDLPAILGHPQPGTLVYCCGPGPLLDAVAEHCAGWPEGTLRVERFTPRAPGDQAGQATPAARSFEVELVQSGLTLAVPPGESILGVIEAAGVPVLSSCTEGTCGTCETPVLAGVPDHRDSVLTPAEQAAGNTMMICVSRSLSPRLVLDL
jgi:ferredoxin-NADP reductase